MQLLRKILLFVLLILGITTYSIAQQAQQHKTITVTFDFESAQAVCKLLTQKKADTAEISKTSRLYGNSLLIRKVKGYSGAGEDVFKRTLKEIIETGNIKGEDPYNFKQVKTKLPAIEKLLSYLSTNRQSFINQVQELISTYTPNDLSSDNKACFLVGGGSLGFTIGGDPTFNVALQQIGEDIEGLKYLVAHELYHNIQHASQNKRSKSINEKPPYYVKAAYGLLYNLWSEGTANLAGDFDRIKTPKAFSAEQQRQSKKNRERKGDNFYLFETLLYRQYTDTTANYSGLYNIAFTTSYDEAAYYVGYEMAKKISQHQGNSVLTDLVSQDPLQFTQAYILLYKSRPDDKSFIRFSSTFEQIIGKLMVWKDRI